MPCRGLRHVGPNLRDARPQAGYLKWGSIGGSYMPDAQLSLAPRTVWHEAIEVYRLRNN